MRAVASFGVTLVTIALIVLVVELVGHEVGQLFAKVSQGLAN
jgi:hypothetical protein